MFPKCLNQKDKWDSHLWYRNYLWYSPELLPVFLMLLSPQVMLTTFYFQFQEAKCLSTYWVNYAKAGKVCLWCPWWQKAWSYHPTWTTAQHEIKYVIIVNSTQLKFVPIIYAVIFIIICEQAVKNMENLAVFLQHFLSFSSFRFFYLFTESDELFKGHNLVAVAKIGYWWQL